MFDDCRRTTYFVDNHSSLETEVLRQSKMLDENAAASFSENFALRDRVEFMHRCLAEVAVANCWGLFDDQALALHETNKSLANKLKDARSDMLLHHANCSSPIKFILIEMIKIDDRRRQAEEALGQLTSEQAQNSELYQ
jgi:hypothetical protein